MIKMIMIAFFMTLSSGALATHAPNHVLSKKPAEVVKPAAKAYTGTWKPPLEIQNKVAK